MANVTQHELERVLAGRKFYSPIRLARPKMKVGFYPAESVPGINQLVFINQQMMMAAVAGNYRRRA